MSRCLRCMQNESNQPLGTGPLYKHHEDCPFSPKWRRRQAQIAKELTGEKMSRCHIEYEESYRPIKSVSLPSFLGSHRVIRAQMTPSDRTDRDAKRTYHRVSVGDYICETADVRQFAQALIQLCDQTDARPPLEGKHE